MKKKDGFVMIELLLAIMMLTVSASIIYGSCQLKYKCESYHYDNESMNELYADEERRKLFWPKKDILPVIVSLK